MTVAATTEKKPRGRPFSRTNQPGREPDAPAEQDFGQLARKILTDPRAQRALLAKARRAGLPAHVIGMLVENAAPAPAPARTAPTAGEVAACLEASVPPFIQRLMYEHARGRLDDLGRPVPTKRQAGRTKRARAEAEPAREQEPQEEPDLEPDQPLAAAAERLRAAERAEREDRSRAVEVDTGAWPEPEPTKAELLAMGRAPREEHDWGSVEHRTACRACRRTWRADANADTTQIRR